MVASFQAVASTAEQESKNTNQHSALELDSGKKLSGFVQYFVDFSLDRIGSPLEENFEPRESLGWNIPLYTRDYVQSLPAPEVTTELALKGAMMSCFNCGGPHTVTECSEPKDFQRIAAARTQFMKLKAPASGENLGRYHQLVHSSRFVPGILSPELKRALGIDETRPDLPYFIYKMRELGYPPGHLVEQREMAGEKNKTLTVYGEPEIEPDRPDSDNEDVYPFKYPGFNAPTPKEVADRSRDFGLPSVNSFDLRHADTPLTEKRSRRRKRTVTETPGGGSSRKRVRLRRPHLSSQVAAADCGSDDVLEEGQIRDELSSTWSVSSGRDGVAGSGLEYCPTTNWSLDFPPGRVDTSDVVRGGHWAIIRDILTARQLKS